MRKDPISHLRKDRTAADRRFHAWKPELPAPRQRRRFRTPAPRTRAGIPSQREKDLTLIEEGGKNEKIMGTSQRYDSGL